MVIRFRCPSNETGALYFLERTNIKEPFLVNNGLRPLTDLSMLISIFSITNSVAYGLRLNILPTDVFTSIGNSGASSFLVILVFLPERSLLILFESSSG